MPDNNKKLDFLKKLNFRKALYPAMSFSFALVVILIFFVSVKFILAGIDKIFYVPTEAEITGQITPFDKADYLIVAKKLGISVVETKSAPQPEASQQPATPAPVITDKKLIKIAIYNSTQTAGLAAKLKAVLVGEGFVVAETGTVSPAQETTTIKISDDLSATSLVEEIKTLVSSKYQATLTTFSDASTFDVEITIGKK